MNLILLSKSMLNAAATVPAACLSAFMASALNQTNFYRARHGAGPLTEDSTIRTTSQQWANYLSDNNLFEHNTAKLRPLGYGENLAMNYASGSESTLTAAACASIFTHKFSLIFLKVNKDTLSLYSLKIRHRDIILYI